MRLQNLLLHNLFILLLVCVSSCKNENKYTPPTVSFTLTDAQLPEYEKEIDHKGILEDLQKDHEKTIAKGRSIYNNACVTCHGNPNQEGSIPTAFKYWKDQFKVGKDPYSIYQTLTKGYGSMPPQSNLTPIEKYEVISYIREEFIFKQNNDQYTEIDSMYLSSLPPGNSKGPKPNKKTPWAEMDYGNFLINTYELVDTNPKPREISEGSSPLQNENLTKANFAYKGIAMRLDEGNGGVAAGKAWMVFDHDLMRIAGAWMGDGFIDWEGILLNGHHNISPRTIGNLHYETPVEPAWADPISGSFFDNRFKAVDNRRFGPLPREWAHYKGLYKFKNKVIISYSIGDANILEKDGLEGTINLPIFSRTLNISPSSNPLKMRIAPATASVALVGNGASLKKENSFYVLHVPKSQSSNIKILIAKAGYPNINQHAITSAKPENLVAFTKGGTAQFPQKVLASIKKSKDGGPFQVDQFELPFHGPWKNQLRLSGIDFLDDKNKAVICSSDGDVWLVDGLLTNTENLVWKRIASGLFQPLGIKIVDKKIFVTCRDQLVKLHDLNGDEEIDFYESFNSDHQVTNHFHEFAMGLQTDKEGNFYYAKSARHARRALVPQHGTLLKVSKDGQTTEIMANGFRAANGVCINPDGSFIITDQEGHWNPMNRINWIQKKGAFYGNMFGYNPSSDSSDTGMEQPLTWIEKEVDQSPSELLWVDSKKWGPLNGSLLSFSYGYGKVFVVPHEKVGTQMQGGVFELPIPRFSTGVMRGRFNAGDGQLYACGLSAWGSTGPELGGFYRIRYEGAKSIIPIGLKAKKDGMEISFSHAVDVKNLTSVSSYQVETWDLKRLRRYGSDHYNKKLLKVSAVKASADNKKVFLSIPNIKPTWVMEISYKFIDSKGKEVTGMIQNTINKLGE
jgi:cytochrome c5